MYSIQEITPQVFWVGGNDRRLERFENMFPLPNGVSYNSYLITDEKTALIDTVDTSIGALYLENVTHVLNGRKLDYLVINHMEPDHCANIEEIVRRYPNVQLVGNKKTFQFLEQYYSLNMSSNYLEIQEGQELGLGKHTLRFYFAPMVHWPEVMFTYEISQGILFSADAFGSFGALSGNVFADEIDFENVFADESRRYYANIVGRYGMQVQAALKKFTDVNIRMICSVHGPIWRKNLAYILEKYDKWSRYLPEKKGVVLFYASMYGNTENVMNALANKLAKRGIQDIRLYDVSKTHPSYIISDVWKYSHMVIGSPTYNMHLYFVMDALLRELSALGLKNRKISLIGNHTWSSGAIKGMHEIIDTMKNIEIVGAPLDVRSTLKPEREPELDALADAIYASLTEA
ncbi:FprA family A-type flavoprotein [Cellulosilyticum sp. I15G10I2]|uniref:FprA family A-type flavoprotein n=1 Tax=Cellulosilyticum sp. I15G10I2 TaxID=1892843 RepID=UPI00085CDEE4|nr:FprA family A-type flavoprotein [Cellulosilyticum sp. I15G10I2]